MSFNFPWSAMSHIWNIGLIFNMELSAFSICKVEKLCPVLVMFLFMNLWSKAVSGIHVFWTPLSRSNLFFLGKPAWTLESRIFQPGVLKFWIQHQSLHGAIRCVTFAYTVPHVESHHMFICFPFLLWLLHFTNLAMGSFFFFHHLEIRFSYAYGTIPICIILLLPGPGSIMIILLIIILWLSFITILYMPYHIIIT